jgi:hypothetical protein
MNAINGPCQSIPSVKHPHPSSPNMDWLYRLPHRDWLELEACDEAPMIARRRLMKNLEKWSLEEFGISAPLVLSEIVTNSLLATAAVLAAHAAAIDSGMATTERSGISVWLHGGHSVIAVLAWDPSVAAPRPRDAEPDEESGRGLAIIEELSANWGYYYPKGMGGKVTWAIINRP